MLAVMSRRTFRECRVLLSKMHRAKICASGDAERGIKRERGGYRIPIVEEGKRRGLRFTARPTVDKSVGKEREESECDH